MKRMILNLFLNKEYKSKKYFNLINKNKFIFYFI